VSLIAVLGPTAAGKSCFAESLARRIGAEILSVDSMQVFRGMDIGTAKPAPESRTRFVYHMVDVADPSDEYTVARFQRRGRLALDAAAGRHVPVVIAGGSGLHFRSLVDPLDFPPTDPEVRRGLEARTSEELVDELLRIDPAANEVVDMANPRRVLRAVEIAIVTGAGPTERASSGAARAVRDYRPVRPFTGLGIDPGPSIADRIVRRLDDMLESGFLTEVADLAPTMGRTARQAVGYREMLRVVEEGTALATAREEAIRATVALVKRQRTYFRKDPRIRWIPWHHDVEQMVDEALEHREEGSTWTS
jgi:tRNA dimethylallyltransferase